MDTFITIPSKITTRLIDIITGNTRMVLASSCERISRSVEPLLDILLSVVFNGLFKLSGNECAAIVNCVLTVFYSGNCCWRSTSVSSVKNVVLDNTRSIES